MRNLSHRATLRSVWIVLAVALTALPVSWLRAQEHDHGHEGAAQTLQLDHGNKWATDAPLREAMTAIRDALQADHPAIHARTQPAAAYKALAQQIDGQLAHIVANCKLPADADANLHVLLMQIIGGADDMREGDLQQARAGAVRVIQALNRYPQYFDHPGWEGVH